MIAIVTGVMFIGYTLVYAAVANGGKLYAHPWDALHEDAYTGERAGASTAAGGGHASTWDRIRNVGGWVLFPERHIPVIGPYLP